MLAGGISDSTRRRIPDFPRPVVLSRTRSGRPCRIAFVREEVLAWCEARIAADRATGPEAA
jgi:predicted DNA-binding transcriptional regulator AlpA